MQLAGIDHLHVEKKGAIDLVTQIDRDVERMFRALIARAIPRSRRPRGGVRDAAAIARTRPSTAGSSIPSTAPPTTRTACRSSAAPVRSSGTASRSSRAIYDPEPPRALHRGARRRRLAERRADARVVGRDADRFAAVHRLSLHACRPTADYLLGLFGDFIRRARAVRRLGVGRDRSGLRRRRTLRRLLGGQAEPVGRLGRRAADRGGGRRGSATSTGGPFDSRLGRGRRVQRPHPRRRWSSTIRSRNRTN